MKNKYVSTIWNIKQRGHENYSFVDVAVNTDNLLFIDPCLIESANDEGSQKAMMYINSFMDRLCASYRLERDEEKRYLLSHAGEQNATRLGYGNGHNGKGNTADGLLDIFCPLNDLIKQIKTIGKVEDLSLLGSG